MWYIYDIKSGLLLVRENEISLHKCSGDSKERLGWAMASPDVCLAP